MDTTFARSMGRIVLVAVFILTTSCKQGQGAGAMVAFPLSKFRK